MNPDKKLEDDKRLHKNKLWREWYYRNRSRKLAENEAYRQAHVRQINKAHDLRKDPAKEKARKAVNNAIQVGRFEKADCQRCGEPKTDFHHTDGYDKDNWFIGVWLCRKHHAELHTELRWKTT